MRLIATAPTANGAASHSRPAGARDRFQAKNAARNGSTKRLKLRK